jgi:hypothetical protein
MSANIAELLKDLEPGSQARVDDVRDALDSGEVLEALASVLTLSEIEPIALLLAYQGGKRNMEAAQDVMLAWADSDSDANEHVDRLALWGIEYGDEGWEIR